MNGWKFGGRVNSMIHEWEYYYLELKDNDLTCINKNDIVMYEGKPLQIKWDYKNYGLERRKFKVSDGHYWYPVDAVKDVRLNNVEYMNSKKYMCFKCGSGLVDGKEHKEEYILQVVQIYYKYLSILEVLTLDVISKFEYMDLMYGEPTFYNLGGAIPPEVKYWAIKFGYELDTNIQSLGLYDESGDEARDGWPYLNKWDPSVCIDMLV